MSSFVERTVTRSRPPLVLIMASIRRGIGARAGHVRPYSLTTPGEMWSRAIGLFRRIWGWFTMSLASICIGV